MVMSTEVHNRLNGGKSGRQDNEFRPKFYKFGVVNGASGSSYVEFGETKIMSAVNGPNELTKSGDLLTADPNKGKIMVHIKYSELGRRAEGRRRDQPSKQEAHLSTMLTDALKPVIILTKFPKAVLEINVTIVQDSGSVLSAMCVGAGLALVDAGIEIHDIVVAADVRLCGSRSLIDPSLEEVYTPKESAETEVYTVEDEGTVSYALMPSIRQVCLLHMQGQVTVSRMQCATREAEEACLSMMPHIRDVIAKRVNEINQ